MFTSLHLYVLRYQDQATMNLVARIYRIGFGSVGIHVHETLLSGHTTSPVRQRQL